MSFRRGWGSGWMRWIRRSKERGGRGTGRKGRVEGKRWEGRAQGYFDLGTRKCEDRRIDE